MVGIKDFVNEAKLKKFLNRRERSLYVKMKGGVNIKDLSLMEGLVKQIHPDIERAYFPRQKVPRFFFALCKDAKAKVEVKKAIEDYKGKELGTLRPSEKINKREVNPNPTEKLNSNNRLNPTTLVLEAIPKELETESLEEEFPKCKEVLRFNERRCYLHFDEAVDACEALRRIATETICGYKISARFDKAKTPTPSPDKTQEQTKTKSKKKTVKASKNKKT